MQSLPRICTRRYATKAKAKVNAVDDGPYDAFCRRWFDLSARHTATIVGAGFAIGAGIELFMVKVWIGKTNFYEVVKKKEVERQVEAQKAATNSDMPSFGEILKQQWEEKKKQMAEEERAKRQQQAEPARGGT